VEQPSLFEAIVRFPGALVRLPSTAKDTLDAINALAERIDRLVSLLEQFEPGVTLAGAGVDVATSGITQALSGLQQAVGSLDGVIPGMATSSAALRGLSDRLGRTSIEIVAGAPEDVIDTEYDDEYETQYEDPDLPLDDLTAMVNQLIGLFASTFSTIPGVRQVLRVTTATPPHRDDH
jgi:hypothetical protein